MKALHLLAFTSNYFTTKFCVHILCPPDIATSPETNRIQSIPSRPPTAALTPCEKRKEKKKFWRPTMGGPARNLYNGKTVSCRRA